MIKYIYIYIYTSDTKHLREILGFLVPVKKYWRELGLALNLKKETLDEIEINNREVKDFKREMMSKWLNWVDMVDDYKPTWRRLADALKDPTVEGHESIAKAIEDKYSIN